MNPTERITPAQDLHGLISDLGNSDRALRRHARQLILREGVAAIPALSEAVKGGSREVRGEAVKALSTLKAPAAAPALIKALEDDDFGIRWSAMDGMIALDRSGLLLLLEALRDKFSSVRLREGARRILRVLNEQDHLDQPLLKVLGALESIEPEVEVPWAAEAGLKSLARQN